MLISFFSFLASCTSCYSFSGQPGVWSYSTTSMYLFQEPSHVKFKLVDLWHHCCEGLERSNLALVDVHCFYPGSTNSWIMILFSLQGPERSEVMLANVTLLQKTVSYPYGHCYYDFTKFCNHSPSKFHLPWHICFFMANITFSLVDLTDSPHQPCHTFSQHCGCTPAKSCHFIIQALNKS